LFRVYGPTEAWFDKTWRLGDLELQDKWIDNNSSPILNGSF
jgi:hypothetical protein